MAGTGRGDYMQGQSSKPNMMDLSKIPETKDIMSGLRYDHHLVGESGLERRVFVFFIRGSKVVLRSDRIQTRESIDHRWRNVSSWARFEDRNQMERQPLPDAVRDAALNHFRSKITFDED
jgi:hypothetical protein